MATLQKKFERFVKKESLFEPSDKLLVAVSGGIDSMVLLHLLHSSGYSVAIAHCNFQLRGNESDLDATLVSNYADNMKVRHFQKNFDTRDYMAEHQMSVQEAARTLRYRWFDELMQTHGFDCLLTAHHANDQAETMLYNLVKGTGIAGLRGIPIANDYIRRPLLFAKRQEIEKYARQEKLQWREDASNQEDKYSRNHIRHKIIPELQQINPGLAQTMLNNSLRYAAIEKLLQNEVSKIKDHWMFKTKRGFQLKMDWYSQDAGGLAILCEILKPFGFNWDQCLSLADGLGPVSTQSSGNKYYASEYALYVDRQSLAIEPLDQRESIDLLVHEFTEAISIPWCTFSFESSDTIDEWSAHNNEASLDADKVNFPIRIRNWQQGDAFIPLGMKGKKKLSDFMIDEKIPVNLKSRVVLFESDGEIIWVAGHRIDDRYKITPKTSRVLIIKMTDHV